MGEAHHLSPSERIELITSARKALDEAGLTEVPIIAGTGVGSTRETIELRVVQLDAWMKEGVGLGRGRIRAQRYIHHSD